MLTTKTHTCKVDYFAETAPVLWQKKWILWYPDYDTKFVRLGHEVGVKELSFVLYRCDWRDGFRRHDVQCWRRYGQMPKHHRDATFRELVAFTLSFPEIEDNFPIVAFGSKITQKDDFGPDNEFVPLLAKFRTGEKGIIAEWNEVAFGPYILTVDEAVP